MSTFILRLDADADADTDADAHAHAAGAADAGRAAHAAGALRVAIKDMIDLAGTPTTAGCRAVAESATPADRDAACLAGIRAAEANGQVRIVGKTNLHELAYGVSGINPWYGTPVNPLDPRLVPGGSSSGSAVAVAKDEADVALGTDTGGSIRIPAACCGVAGLKTTWGRVPLDGVRPLGPSLDTVGPMARDVAGLVAGMHLLEPGFRTAQGAAARVGRVRLPAARAIDSALDRVLADSGLDVVAVPLPGWAEATEAGMVILCLEAWEVNRSLVDAGGLGDDVRQRLLDATRLSSQHEAAALATRQRWQDELAAVFEQVDVLALPVLGDQPPLLQDAERLKVIRRTMPVNLAGVPAVALPIPPAPIPPAPIPTAPIPTAHIPTAPIPTAPIPTAPIPTAPMATPGLPASLQLVGPPGSEELLLATAALLEQTRRPLDHP